MNGLQVDCRKWQEVIQQLRGPNFTQFWPPTPLEWTIDDILHNTYPLSTWLSINFLCTDHLPTSSCPRSWMTPEPKYYQKLELKSPRTLKVKQGAREEARWTTPRCHWPLVNSSHQLWMTLDDDFAGSWTKANGTETWLLFDGLNSLTDSLQWRWGWGQLWSKRGQRGIRRTRAFCLGPRLPR